MHLIKICISGYILLPHNQVYSLVWQRYKLKEDAINVDNLPLRPVISNIGTATYQISKYLASLLSKLAKSDFTINNTKDFLSRIRDKTIASDCVIVSLDVESLFTSVPLDFTINLILDKVYKYSSIQTKLKCNELKQLLELCTKVMHFSFEGDIYSINK